MIKTIKVPDEIWKDIKILAINADKSLMRYIQDVLIEHVIKSKKK